MPPSRMHSSRPPGGSRSSPPPRGGRTARPRTPREEDLVELEYAEALGATVDEAIKNALEILGADADEVEVQVLEKGHRSFLGIGRTTPYRVRVSWREDLDEEVIEEEVSEREPREQAPRPAPPREPEARETRERRGAFERRGSPESAEAPPASRPAPAAHAQVPPPQSSPQPKTPSSLASTNAFEIADQVRQLLQRMGFTASVESRLADDELWIRIRLDDEEDAFLLHGRRGETRAALQHLLQRILVPRAEGGPTVLVDINDRWEHRLEDLRSEALDLARRASEEGRPFRTRPLPSEERRIIHRALADRTDVRTHSEGDGREKRVVVSPAGSSSES